MMLKKEGGVKIGEEGLRGEIIVIGIYRDDFIEYLRSNLGDPIKLTSKNIVCRCPWCELGREKNHYHLWISIEAPIFHCFHAGCEQKGIISKLIKYISGVDKSDKFVDKEKIKLNVKKKIEFDHSDIKLTKIKLPDLKMNVFNYKKQYIKQRLKFTNISIASIKGLIFDVNEFININNISVDPKLFRIKDFLHSNFVGFVTEHQSIVIFRNVDPKSSFRYFKMDIQPSKFLDYYKLLGSMRQSTNVVLAEGIFDIYTEHIFDMLGLKSRSSLYVAALSTSYHSLVKSIAYHEQIFRIDVHILSDRNVELGYYEKMKKYNSHLINSLTVYYNKMGKDFNDTPVVPVKYVIKGT